MPESTLKYSSVPRRLFAWILDVLLFLPFMITVGIIHIIASQYFNNIYVLSAFLMKSFIFFWLIYNGVFIRKFGATLGKKIVGISVVSENGIPLTYFQIIIREILKIADTVVMGLGCFWIFFTIKRQTLHDQIMNTIVVYKEPPEDNHHVRNYLFISVGIWVLSGIILGIVLIVFFSRYFSEPSQSDISFHSGPSVTPDISPTPQSGLHTNGSRLIDDKLGVEVDTKNIKSLPPVSAEEQDFGKRITVEWQPIEIAGGYFYDTNGKLMNYLQVAEAYLYQDSIKSIKPRLSAYKGLPAAYLDTSEIPPPYANFTPFSLVSVQKGVLVYVFKHTTKASLDELLNAVSFFDTNSLEKNTSKIISPTNEGKIFLPASGVINTKQPVFMGKIRQEAQLFLPTEFGLKGFSYNEEEKRFQLAVKPGKVQNLDIYIDSEKIQNVYGVPEFPTTQCDITHPNSSGGRYVDSGIYGESRNIEPFLTQQECIDKKKQSLPPMIFLFKANNPLSEGPHTVSIRSSYGYKNIQKFTIQTSYIIPEQILPTTSSASDSSSFSLVDATDNCMQGYYYDSNYLRIPLPVWDAKNIFYTLTFPQSEKEKGIFAENRQVFIQFDSNRFPLRFPQSSEFYFQGEKSVNDGNEYLKSENGLYLPSDHLVFSDGSKAHLWVSEGYNSSAYFEIYPTDLFGTVYSKSGIPWTTSSWSGCDG